MLFFETSAFDNINVMEAFENLVNEIYEKKRDVAAQAHRGVKIFQDKELEK